MIVLQLISNGIFQTIQKSVTAQCTAIDCTTIIQQWYISDHTQILWYIKAIRRGHQVDNNLFFTFYQLHICYLEYHIGRMTQTLIINKLAIIYPHADLSFVFAGSLALARPRPLGLHSGSLRACEMRPQIP